MIALRQTVLSGRTMPPGARLPARCQVESPALTITNAARSAWIKARLIAGAAIELVLAACEPTRGGDLDVRFEGSWPGYRRGSPTAIAIDRGHAWVATDDDVQVLDLEDPVHPRRVGGIQRAWGQGTGRQEVHDLSLDGPRLYLATDRIEVLDVSRPEQLQWLGQLEMTINWYGQIFVSGGLAFEVSQGQAPQEGALRIFDVSDPGAPRRVGGYSPGFVYSRQISPQGVLVAGRYAYVATLVTDSNPGGSTMRGVLWIVDVSDLARPRLARQYSSAYGWEDSWYPKVGIELEGNLAYFTPGHLEILDVSDPAKPQRLASYRGAGPIEKIGVSGEYLCLAEGEAGLEMVNVTDPQIPTLVGSLTNLSAAAVAVSGNYAYVPALPPVRPGVMPNEPAALNIVDIRNPVRPVLVGRHGAGDTQAVAVFGQSALVADGPGGLARIDLSRPNEPREMATLDLGAECRGVAVVRDVVAVAAGAKGLQVVQIGARHGLSRLSEVDTGGDAWDVAARGEEVYVTDGNTGLSVIDLSDPSTPRYAGRHGDLVSPRNVRVFDHYAYVLEAVQTIWRGPQTRRLAILDLDGSTGHLPGALISRFELSRALSPQEIIHDVAVTDRHAYLATDEGVQILDVTDPAHPILAGTYSMTVSARSLAVAGSLLAVGGEWWDAGSAQVFRGFLHLLDITEPAAPRRVGGAALSDPVSGLVLQDHQVLVAIRRAGLTIFEHSGVGNPQRVGRLKEDGPFLALALSGSLAVVAIHDYDASRHTLRILDVSDPARVRPVGQAAKLDAWQGPVCLAAGHVYVGGSSSLTVLDVRDVASPRRVAVVTNIYPEGLVASGDRLWVTSPDRPHGTTILPVALRGYDISDPSQPRHLGEYRPGVKSVLAGARLAVAGNLGLLAIDRDLHFLELTDPTQPRLAGARRFRGSLYALALTGAYAYVREKLSGDFWSPGLDEIHVLDLSDAADLRTLGRIEIRSEVNAGLVSEALVGVLAGSGWQTSGSGAEVYGEGVQLIDVSDATRPRRVGGNSAVAGHLMAASGGLLMVAGNPSDYSALDLLEWQPIIRFDDGPGAATEGGTNGFAVFVERVGDLSAPLTVELRSADGSARAGEDYVAQRRTLKFAAGQKRLEVRIPVLDDALTEGPESFSLSLSNPSSGWALGSPSRSSHEILDDEPAPPAGCGNSPCFGTELGFSPGGYFADMATSPSGELYLATETTLTSFDPVTARYTSLVMAGIGGIGAIGKVAVEGRAGDVYFVEGGTGPIGWNDATLAVYRSATRRREIVARGLHWPESLFIGSTGNIYVLETPGGPASPPSPSNRVLRFASGSGEPEVVLAGTPSGADALVVAGDGSIVLGLAGEAISDYPSDRGSVLRYPPGGGQPQTLLTNLPAVTDLAIDGDDNLYVTGASWKRDSVGIGLLPHDDAQLVPLRTDVLVWNLALDAAGNIFYSGRTTADPPATGLFGMLTPFPVRPRPRVTGVASRWDGELELTLEGSVGKTLHLEASPDLRAWSSVFSFVNTQPSIQLLAPEGGRFTRRFYRLREDP